MRCTGQQVFARGLPHNKSLLPTAAALLVLRSSLLLSAAAAAELVR
jgi:hypothetical protein